MKTIGDRLDLTSLVAGAAVIVLGGLIWLQEDGAISLDAGWMLSAVAAAAGVALVASGMGARRR